MTTARDYLAAVQQRAEFGSMSMQIAADALSVPRLIAALTAALDELDEWGGRNSLGLAPRLRAAITDALTPKENDDS